MRAIRTALAFLLAAALLTVPALAIDLEPGTGSGFYCRDSANVLSSETEELLAEYNAVLENQCDGAQLVVATVSYLDEDADLAAAELMSDWGVGSASQSNGMLLLLVSGEYRGWLSVGDGLDEAFDDDTAALYLDTYFWDDVDADRFDDAVQTLAVQLYNWYLDYYDVSAVTAEQPAESAQPARSAGSFLTGVIALLVIFALLWFAVSVSRYGRMRTTGYRGSFFPILWFGGGSLYRNWRRRQPPPPPPPGPGPGPGGPAGFGGPGGFMGGGFSAPRRNSSFSQPRPRGSGFGGRPGGGAGRSSGGFRGGGGFRGSGGGGHSGGGGAGRR